MQTRLFEFISFEFKKIFVVSRADDTLPFQLEDASRPDKEFEREDVQFSKVNLQTRLDNRVIDLRVSSFLKIGS